jgi:hypothetical protein
MDMMSIDDSEIAESQTRKDLVRLFLGVVVTMPRVFLLRCWLPGGAGREG